MAINQGQLAGTQQGLSELRNRLLFVLVALLVYRMGTHIPVPGINPDRLAALFDQQQGGILDLFNMFSGGALERMSILALSVVPYITSSIIMNLMTMMYPTLQQLRKEGESGRRKITQYTRWHVAFGNAGEPGPGIFHWIQFLFRCHDYFGDRRFVHDVAW